MSMRHRGSSARALAFHGSDYETPGVGRGRKYSVTVDTAEERLDTVRSAWSPSCCPGAEYDASNMVALVCGPEIMMRFAVQNLRNAAGVDAGRRLRHDGAQHEVRRRTGAATASTAPDFVCKDGPVFDVLARREAVLRAGDLR